MDKKKTIFVTIFVVITLCLNLFGGCLYESTPEGMMSVNTSTGDGTEDEEYFNFIASFYRNNGELWLMAEGDYFNITPNKVKVWGYDSDGSYISMYETSSVVTVQINEAFLESCGETIIFQDSRLEMLPFPEISNVGDTDDEGFTDNSVKNDRFYDYIALTRWWYDYKVKGQGGSKLVLIQSQDGFDIGMFTGNEIEWSVAQKLPKTTLLTIDGKQLFIHRCNFVIIDTELLEENIVE